MPAKTRKFKGFGVVTRQGRLLWQYSRPDKAQTIEAYERHNPQLEDQTPDYELVRVTKIIEPVE